MEINPYEKEVLNLRYENFSWIIRVYTWCNGYRRR